MTNKVTLHILVCSILMLFGALCAEPMHGKHTAAYDDTILSDSVIAAPDSAIASPSISSVLSQ